MRPPLPWLALVLSAVLASGCERSPPAGLTPLAPGGELVVLTLRGPTTYFDDADGTPSGLERELAERFAQQLSMRPRFVFARDKEEIRGRIAAGEAHIGAAGLHRPKTPLEGVRYGPGYQSVRPLVVYDTEGPAPKDWSDLAGQTVGLLAGQADVLDLPRRVLEASKIVERPTVEALIESLTDGALDAAVIDDHALAVTRNLHPHLGRAFAAAPARELAWAFPAAARGLDKRLETFFAQVQRDGSLARLIDRYYGHVDRLPILDAEVFRERAASLLPDYRPLFVRAQDESGIEWRLLAAVAYQESQWDPVATSPTGVRGLMMLTEETARRFGVTDRLDPGQSIRGGAQLLAWLKTTVPPRVGEPDRTWLALAAFNIGYGHLEDARVLAQRRGLNPDAWTDLKQVLPDLARPEVAGTLKLGPARGHEAVDFVENVRVFYDILARIEAPHRPRLKPAWPECPATEPATLRRLGLLPPNC